MAKKIKQKQVENLPENMGDLPSLTTTHKTTIVGAINEVNAKSNDIKIGGRNLLKADWTTSIELLQGETYTLSFRIKAPSSPGYKFVHLWRVGQSWGSDAFQTFSINSSSDVVSITFVCSITDFYYFVLESFDWNYDYAQLPTLQIGNKATEWHPAPEDQIANWSQTDPTKFGYIKNKPDIGKWDYYDETIVAQSILRLLAFDPTIGKWRPAIPETVSVGSANNWGNNVTNIFGGVSGTSGIDYLYAYNSATGHGHILTLSDIKAVLGYDPTTKVSKSGDSMTGNLFTPNLTTALSFLNAGVVNDNAGLKLWSGGGNSQYGISVNAVGGVDIMANQPGQPVRIWSGGDNVTPIRTADFNGRNVTFYGTFYNDGKISTGAHGTSEDWIAKVSNLGNATGIGFANGSFSGLPYFYHPTGGYKYLATIEYINNQDFASVTYVNTAINNAIANIPVYNGQLTVNTTADLVGGYVYLPSGNVSTTLGLATHILNAIADGLTAYNWGNHATAGYLTLGALNGYATQNWVWTVINSLAIKTRQYDPTDPVNNDYWDKINIKSFRHAYGFDVCNYEPQAQEYVSIFDKYGAPYLNEGILGSIALICPHNGTPVIKGTVESQVNLNQYISNDQIYFCLRYFRDTASPSSLSGELYMLSSSEVANYMGYGNVEMFSGIIILGVATLDNTLMVQHREF